MGTHRHRQHRAERSAGQLRSAGIWIAVGIAAVIAGAAASGATQLSFSVGIGHRTASAPIPLDAAALPLAGLASALVEASDPEIPVRSRQRSHTVAETTESALRARSLADHTKVPVAATLLPGAAESAPQASPPRDQLELALATPLPQPAAAHAPSRPATQEAPALPTRPVEANPLPVQRQAAAPPTRLAPLFVIPPGPVNEPDAGLRIFVHYSTTAADGADTARRLSAHLRARGYSVADIRSVSFPISTPRIRYYFDGDATDARRLASDFHAFEKHPGEWQTEVRIEAFGHFRPLPREGNVELWIPSASPRVKS